MLVILLTLVIIAMLYEYFEPSLYVDEEEEHLFLFYYNITRKQRKAIKIF